MSVTISQFRHAPPWALRGLDAVARLTSPEALAQVAAQRAEHLDRLEACLPAARAAVADELARIIAAGRPRTITSDTVVTIDMGDAPPSTAPLGECFPDGGDDLADAIADLAKTGEHTGGGGAAPHYVLRLPAE
ncbi:MAG TPA: hypothetical protein VKX28_27010 [Xanthobacteraceae bacterium]|nr:hypothetical protein [Xanthobacteraceae bacterium]